VSEPGCRVPLRLNLAPRARTDIREALLWSNERFGERAAIRYRELIRQALHDIADDPERPGSKPRSDLGRGIRTYHLFFSRGRVRDVAGAVNAPRHPVVYRRRGERLIDVVRILHDSRDLARHLPDP
jgi:toxin ParE1/3/4